MAYLNNTVSDGQIHLQFLEENNLSWNISQKAGIFWQIFVMGRMF